MKKLLILIAFLFAVNVADACSCSDWDCTYQGGSNSGCRRYCWQYPFSLPWYEYKECYYCPDPESLCPPSFMQNNPYKWQEVLLMLEWLEVKYEK